MTEKKPICCICGKECENEWGNNPFPLIKDEESRCCNDCNIHVINYRLLLNSLKTKDDAIEFIRKNYLETIK